MIEDFRVHTSIATLKELNTQAYRGSLWRVTPDGMNPTQFFANSNRWDDGTFAVLYTSLSREGALAEMRYHVTRGQPIPLSGIRYYLHELQVSIEGVLDLTDKNLLSGFGIDPANYGKFPYLKRKVEYEACQKLGKAAHSIGSKDSADVTAILVPNARHDCNNMVVFGDYVSFGTIQHIKNHGVIDWSKIGEDIDIPEI